MNKKNICENGRNIFSLENFENSELKNNTHTDRNLNYDDNNFKGEKKFEEYDEYKIKHIIRENLIEQYKKFPTLNKNKFEDFINDKIDVQSYLLDKEIKENYLEFENLSVANSDSILSQHKQFSELDSKQNNRIEEINQLELNAINKAKELETQIKEINTKRIELVIKDFKEKLIEEGKEEFEIFFRSLQDEFKITLLTINEVQSKQINRIYELQNKITDYSDMLKSISDDLKEQKILLNSNFEKYLDRMEKEKNASVEKYKTDMNGFIRNRVRTFENYLNSQMNK